MTGMGDITSTTNYALCALHRRATPTEDRGRHTRRAHDHIPGTTCAQRDEKDQGLTVKTDMVMMLAMVLATTMMVAVEAAMVIDGDMDVGVLEGGLTRLRLPPSLSKPHDPPYPTQPYATTPL